MLSNRVPAPANDGETPLPLPSPERLQELLFDAARLGRDDVIPALIHAGADITARDAAGYSPLILSSYHGHKAVTALLLRLGAPVDQIDGARGNSALMGAAFKGLSEIAECLLDAGAEPDLANQAGQTALMFAALFDRTAIVSALLARGADPHRVDVAGNSAVSVAAAQGNDPMVARLTSLPRRAARL